jgi:hypothetical protein
MPNMAAASATLPLACASTFSTASRFVRSKAVLRALSAGTMASAPVLLIYSVSQVEISSAASAKPWAARQCAPWIPQDFLDLADLPLYLASVLFGFAFAFQLAVPGDFARNLLDTALHLVKLAFCFVPST